MTASVSFAHICGFSAGNHTLGLELKEAGVTVAAGVATIDTTQACRARPKAYASSPAAPGGYTTAAAFQQFRYSKTSGTIGATQTVFDMLGNSGCFKVTIATNGDLTFIVGGVTTVTFTPSGTHHIDLVCCKNVAGGGIWNSGDSVRAIVIVDKVVLYDQIVTSAGTGGFTLVQPTFGASAGVATGGNTLKYAISHTAGGWTDISAFLGKVTVTEWTPRLGVTPPTGYDIGNKSTGTDAAALVDERPPAASGTTDVDYFQCLFNTTNQKQVIALAQNVLNAGDTLYAAIVKFWARAIGTSKTSSFAPVFHDGTNITTSNGASAVTSPTSYAEADFAGPRIFHNAPDGTLLSTKGNAYFNGCFIGVDVNAVTANAEWNFDALVTEMAIILAGDDISLTGIVVPRRPIRNLLITR